MTIFAVPEMDCTESTLSIEMALSQLDPDARIDADIDACRLVVETSAHPALVLTVLNQAGFAANVAR